MQYGKLYFYTSTIRNWIPLISEHHFEPIIIDSLSYLHRKECLKVYGFVIMPNHMHLLLEQLKSNGKETPIASLMKYTAHQFEQYLLKNDQKILKDFEVDWYSRKINFWQPHPDKFELYKEKTIRQKLKYIHYNPLQEHWALVKEPIDYFYSSARFYETGENSFPFLYHYDHWLKRA
jgi:putative transposase